MKYRLISRRKYFYPCPICSIVYITAKALKGHYGAMHPTLPCDVEELATGNVYKTTLPFPLTLTLTLTEPSPTDPMEDDERFDDFNENSSTNFNMYKEDSSRLDLYSLPKAQVINVPADLSTTTTTTTTTAPGPSLVNELVDYVPTSYSPANRLITLTAPLEPTVTFHPQQFQLTNNVNPIYIKLETGEIIQQNGQLSKQATIITTEQVPVVAEQQRATLPPQPTAAAGTALAAESLPVHLLPPLPPQPSAHSKTTKSTANTPTFSNESSKHEKKYKCEFCGKSFSTIYNKRRHDDMFHNKQTQAAGIYKCASCDKTFSSIYNKTRHENVHKPINERLKFKCVINNCNRGFTTQFILKMHIKKVHNMDVHF